MATRKHSMLLFIGLMCLTLLITAPLALAQIEKAGVYRIALKESKILRIDDTVKRFSVGNPSVIDSTMISKNELLMIGLAVGRTELSIWTENSFNTCVVYVYDDILELKGKISDIVGKKVADAISICIVKETAVIKGWVSSLFESMQVEKLAALYYPKVLNLLEIKSKEPEPVEMKKTLSKTAVVSMAEPVEPIKNEKIEIPNDIVEMKTAREFKPNKDSYPVLEAPAISAPVPSESDMNKINEQKIKIITDANRVSNMITKVIVLQNIDLGSSSTGASSTATTAASTASSTSSTSSTTGTSSTGSSSNVLSVLDKLKSPEGSIIPDVRTNSLFVIDKAEVIEKMEAMVKILDIASPQVLIEAKIIEVTLGDNMTSTLQWIYDTLYNPTTTSGMNNKAVSFNSDGMSVKLDFGKISSDHFNSTILPQITKLHGRILSAPSTSTLDKKKATFEVTDTVPYNRVVNQTNNGISTTQNSTETANSTIKLDVTPTVNQQNTIRLDLHVKVGTFLGLKTIAPGNDAPLTNTRESYNIVEVKNNETLVIAGFIQNNVNKNATVVPFVSKIPFIGKLFTNKKSENTRTELVIFITPKIIGNDSRYAVLDKEKYTKIVENKYPNVDEKFKFSEIFGSKNEDREVKKTVQSDFEIPKAARDMLESPRPAEVLTVSKPEPKAFTAPVKKIPAPFIAPKKEEPKFSETQRAISVEIEKTAPVCNTKKIVEDARPILINEMAVEKPHVQVENKRTKTAYRSPGAQQMIESIRAKVVARKK